MPKEPEHLARFDDHEFMHKNHVTDHKVECFHCHSEIRHGRDPAPELSEATCARCHEGKHDYTARLYRGTGARGVKDMPSSMWAAKVHCIGCHQILGGIPGHAPHSTYEAGERSCIECHGDDGKGMLADWKADMAAALKEAEANLARAEAAAKTLTGEATKRTAAQLLEDARFNLDFVRYGKGVHNLGYATAVLETVNAAAGKVAELGPKLGAR